MVHPKQQMRYGKRSVQRRGGYDKNCAWCSSVLVVWDDSCSLKCKIACVGVGVGVLINIFKVERQVIKHYCTQINKSLIHLYNNN